MAYVVTRPELDDVVFVRQSKSPSTATGPKSSAIAPSFAARLPDLHSNESFIGQKTGIGGRIMRNIEPSSPRHEARALSARAQRTRITMSRPSSGSRRPSKTAKPSHIAAQPNAECSALPSSPNTWRQLTPRIPLAFCSYRSAPATGLAPNTSRPKGQGQPATITSFPVSEKRPQPKAARSDIWAASGQTPNRTQLGHANLFRYFWRRKNCVPVAAGTVT